MATAPGHQPSIPLRIPGKLEIEILKIRRHGVLLLSFRQYQLYPLLPMHLQLFTIVMDILNLKTPLKGQIRRL